MAFHHERLIVYRKAIEFAAVADGIIPRIGPGQTHLRDQLARAASSISLNIAEGTGEFKRKEKGRFYRMARRSATECAAIMDVLTAVGYSATDQLETGRALLDEIVAMLTVMARNQGPEGLRSGKGAGS